VLECVVNISEGRDRAVLDALAEAAGPDLLDVHTDPDHHRSVLTLVGEEAARRVAEVAVARIDLRGHQGAHPRIGAVDVVPFVPLADTPMADACAARDRFASWAASTLGLPCFRYGPERSLPEVRRGAFTALVPDLGPARPHPTAGAVAVAVAASVRGPAVRTLGLAVGDRVQVSMNLIAPDQVGPAEVYDRVAAEAEVSEAELVGLVPEAVLQAVSRGRWAELDLAPDRTIEARLRRARP
jgi:glutamate formiminotransferase